MKTKGMKLLGIRRPIIQGGMQHFGTPELAAAVSNSGGMGTINVTIYPTPEAFRQAVRETKARTDQPFCVNISLLPDVTAGERTMDYIEICGQEGVRAIETAGRRPDSLVAAIHNAGCLHIHKVPTVRHALSAQRAGVDAVTIVGAECGGHPGQDLVGTVVLAAKAAQEIEIPYFIGGGIADGRGLAAMLALGADAVVMGTRFVVTKECIAHENFKRWIMDHGEKDTALIQRSIHNMMRAANNQAAQACLVLEERGATLEELLEVISGERARKAQAEGDPEGGVLVAGQAMGLIHEIPTVAELFQSMWMDAMAASRRLGTVLEE